MKAGSKDF